ncbi:TIGR02678 family protein [Bacillus mycoides]|uniref:TIGR02678 family protein n=1 Tax=Bacillus mycoides TaxID=1405 RepID=UPI00339CFDE7
MEEKYVITDHMKELVEYLFEYMFIDRKKHRDIYYEIRRLQKELTYYVSENFKYNLLVHSDFIKLEKVTTSPKPWMGIERFKEPRDYVIMCCFMAYLEQQITNEFITEDLTTAIKNYFPGEAGIQWEGNGGYQNRLSLIRVVRALEELGIIVILDQNIDDFKDDDKKQVLFQKQAPSHYFMRNLPFDFTTCQSPKSLNLKRQLEKEITGILPKYELNRRLFIEPSIRKQDLDEGLYEYLKRNIEQMESIVEETSSYQLELYKTGAMLTRTESYKPLTTFPNLKMESHLTMQLSSYVRELIMEKKIHKEFDGEIHMTRSEFLQLIDTLKVRNGDEWTASYRQMSAKQICKEFIPFLKSWGFCNELEDRESFILYDSLGRVSGTYNIELKQTEWEIGGVEKTS